MKKDTKSVLPAVQHLFSWKLKHLNSHFSICRNSLASTTSDWSGSLMLPSCSASRKAGTCSLSAVRRNRNMGALKRQGSRGWLCRAVQVQTGLQGTALLVHPWFLPVEEERGMMTCSCHPYVKSGCNHSKHSINPRACQFPSVPYQIHFLSCPHKVLSENKIRFRKWQTISLS